VPALEAAVLNLGINVRAIPKGDTISAIIEPRRSPGHGTTVCMYFPRAKE
jgi:hypothetical protein